MTQHPTNQRHQASLQIFEGIWGQSTHSINGAQVELFVKCNLTALGGGSGLHTAEALCGGTWRFLKKFAADAFSKSLRTVPTLQGSFTCPQTPTQCLQGAGPGVLCAPTALASSSKYSNSERALWVYFPRGREEEAPRPRAASFLLLVCLRLRWRGQDAALGHSQSSLGEEPMILEEVAI